MSILTFTVHGQPAPQGSKDGYVNPHTGRPAVVESSPKVRPWRQDVRQAALDAREATGHETLTGPVHVHLVFAFTRTKGHYGSGRNAAHLKPSAPAEPHNRSTYDIDKLARSTLDALGQAGVFGDDSQVSHLVAAKTYCEGRETPGCRITVSAA